MMHVEPKLKPLYANLKRLSIGEYLHTKEFELFMLESGLDETWQACEQEVRRKSSVIILGYHNTEDDEEALMYFLSLWHEQYPRSLGKFVLPLLYNFSVWKPIKIDYSMVVESLRKLNIPKADLDEFIEGYNKIQEGKPLELKKEKVNVDKSNKPTVAQSNKVFIVHGHDDKSRLELCNLLKDDLKLDPIVLQDQANNSIETIIGKFERLASDCSAAIVLFTPDDNAGDNKRARQNVIFELGYFLGKFHEEKDRKIIILKKGNIEIPSDINGVLYFEYSKAVKEIFYDLRKQLEHWGYNV